MGANSTMAKTNEINSGTFSKTTAFQSELKNLEPIQEEHENQKLNAQRLRKKSRHNEESYKSNQLQIVINDEQ